MDISTFRQANHTIDSIYLNRWSPRGFSNREVEEEKIYSIFEAARWAPSAANWQPWRFVYAQTEEDRNKFLSFIYEGNIEWCKNAPVLVAIISKTTRNEEGAPNVTHAFDTGAAWGYLSLEASRQGLITHGMGGFDRVKAKEVLNIPEEYEVQALFALGYHDPDAKLSDQHREREVPSGRNPVSSFLFEGTFK
ncbi:nitroreductase family protein [Pseudogracilibacillus sp. SE30717A]|uniref:nitroreductase family protein n=1 Tax=Pseudogracilibacillus sp. SE30717A TaxID=3098293 RepID=UPI00300E6626